MWGRNRLPLHDDDWQQPFTIHPLTRGPRGGRLDDMLPTAHTCFFSLDLPLYSSFARLRSKLLFAVANCQAIDTDFDPNSGTGMASGLVG